MPQHRRPQPPAKPATDDAVLIADWDALTGEGRSIPDHGAFADMLAALRVSAGRVVIVAARAHDALAWAGKEFKVVESANDNGVFEQIDAAVGSDRVRRLFLSAPAGARGKFAELIYRLKRRGVAVGVLTSEAACAPAITALSSSISFLPSMPLPPRIFAA
ncbi:MAG TPA: hypothetical protein VF620_02890 [Allosphingosinicella sp.]